MKSNKPAAKMETGRSGERGFSVLELMVVCGIALTIMAMAILQVVPASNAARADDATRIVMEQVRQAREFSIENRRYVQIQFNTASNGQPQIVTTQMNTLTANAGNNAVLSAVPVEAPVQYCTCLMGDTPDAYGNASAITFESTANGPSGGMLFQSDGELVDGTTYAAINGTIFLGINGKQTWSRAVTVLGTTGRVRAYKSTGTAWVSF